MRKKPFLRNTKALSIMQDAILFLVMVSISATILLPAMTSDIPQKGLVQQHKQSLVNDALLMLKSSKSDFIQYDFAHQIYELKINGKNIFKNSIFHPLLSPITNRELLHKTYVDLCLESISSQLKILDQHRINILTINLDETVKREVKTALQNYLGKQLDFQLLVKWRPIKGISFGGNLTIGVTPPRYVDTYVATSLVTMTNSLFTQVRENIKTFIEDEIQIISNSAEKIKEEMKNSTTLIVKKTVEICISNITKSLLQGYLNKPLGCMTESLNLFSKGNFSSKFLELICDTISSEFGFPIQSHNFATRISDYLVNQTAKKIHSLFDEVIDNLDFSTIRHPERFVKDFFINSLSISKAEFVLTIWEV